ncbi:MAG: hypothetical protein RLY21_549 [Planctomycetota bacterium]|jgi:hypothetical protein
MNSLNSPSPAASNRNSVLSRRLAWTLWALIPVGLLAFHFGPGQQAWKEDRAARIVARAESLQAAAVNLQDAAYDAHLAAIEARLAAFGQNDDALRNAALEANKAEETAYAKAAAAWRDTANALAEAEAVVEETGGPVRDEIRLARGRALVRTGEVAAGAAVLEDLLDELMQARAAESAGAPVQAVRTAAGGESDAIARATREELATAYYYGARLLRLAGEPAEQWREAAARAKQNFRYLAEDAKSRGASRDEIANHEKNGELVLNLEQSSLDELYAKPRPKDSPTGNCNGLCNNKGKKPGKKPGGDKPSKGAGMNGEIGNGW